MLVLDTLPTVASPSAMSTSDRKVKTGSLTVISGTQRDVTYTRALNNIQERTTKIRTGCGACCYRSTSRGFRNFLRVGLATGGSCVGGLIAGLPGFIAVAGSSIAAIWMGSWIGGGANGCSTIFAYETDSEDRDSDLEIVIARQAEQIEFLKIEIKSLRSPQPSERRVPISPPDIANDHSAPTSLPLFHPDI